MRGLTEIRMIHGLVGSQAGLVVIAQQLVQEIQSLWADQGLVFTVDKPFPPLARMPAGKKIFLLNKTVNYDYRYDKQTCFSWSTAVEIQIILICVRFALFTKNA